MAESIRRIEGRACVLRGNDTDTDRILPARYLRCTTFDGLGEHAFADDRAEAGGAHPLDQQRFANAAILIVGRNFGCGSSREHAPQSLMRRGFRAFVGESFAEIFAGNCTALGLPCATLEAAQLEELMQSVEKQPNQQLALDLESRKLHCALGEISAGFHESARSALTGGSWNATAVLLEAGAAIEKTARALPYTARFAG